MKKITVLLIAFFIGYYFDTIKDFFIEEIKQTEKIQYCNDIYMGRSYLIDRCLSE